MAVTRPGAGPLVVTFSYAEVKALGKYAIGYPMEEATAAEAIAFDSGLRKIREAQERRRVKRTHARKYRGGQ